jgi:hypothetical protein
MGKERLQEEELAAFTDMLLAGRLSEAAPRPPLAETIEVLARTISPQAPPEHLKLLLRRRIIAGWGEKEEAAGLSLFARPRYRRAWAAVAALLIVAVAAVLLLPGGGGEMIGTAWSEGVILPLFLLLLTLLGVLLAAWWLTHRR